MKLCGFEAGPDQPFFLIAGTCVVESEAMALDTAGELREITDELDIPFIYKSSFDKANRSSQESFRGPGREEGLRILGEVKSQLGVPPRVCSSRTRFASSVCTLLWGPWRSESWCASWKTRS